MEPRASHTMVHSRLTPLRRSLLRKAVRAITTRTGRISHHEFVRAGTSAAAAGIGYAIPPSLSASAADIVGAGWRPHMRWRSRYSTIFWGLLHYRYDSVGNYRHENTVSHGTCGNPPRSALQRQRELCCGARHIDCVALHRQSGHTGMSVSFVGRVDHG